MRSITAKFLVSAGLLAAFFSGFLLYRSWHATHSHVMEVTAQQAVLALEFDLAIRDYVAEHVRPELERRLPPDEFIPEAMSTSYVARRVFERVRGKMPGYLIKFSSDDPRNPANLAGPDEAAVLNYFRDNPEVEYWAGDTRIDGKEYYACFTPRRMTEGCLGCHGRPKDAPASLVSRYGANAGFGRKVGDVVAMDTVAIPVDRVHAAMTKEATAQLGLVALGILGLCGGVAALFHFLVAKRLRAITKHLRDAATADEGASIRPIDVQGEDEIADLAKGFNALAGRLEAVHASLERRVAERTEELAAETAERTRIAESLQRSDVRFRSLFDNMQVGISVFQTPDDGATFVFEGMNQIALEMTGINREDILGKNLIEVFPLAEPYAIVAAVRDAWKSGRRVHIPDRLYEDDRFTAWLDIYAYRLASNEVVVVFNDVTARKEFERELLREKAISDSTLDALPGIFYLFNSEGHYLRWNRNFEQVTGYTSAELSRMSPWDFFDPEDHEKVTAAMEDVAENGETSVELMFHTKDGSVAPYFFTGARVVLDDEPCLVGMGVDMSEYRRIEDALRESKERLRVLLESASDVIFSYDENLVLQSVSAAAEKALGIRPSDSVGRKLFDVIQPLPEYMEIALTNTQRIFAGEPVEPTYYEYAASDGSVHAAEITGSPLIKDGRIVAAVCVARDVTERMRSEELNRQRLAAEAACQAKSDFLATMSHEIRTPMNGIIGMLDLLGNTAVNAKQQHYVKIAKVSADSLLALIRDILDFSKIEAGKLEIEEISFDLGALVGDTAELFRHEAEKKSVQFRWQIADDVPTEVIGDPERIRRVLSNLVSNAVKFTDRGEIELRIQLEENQDAGAKTAAIRFEVEDTGIGIPPERQDRLFRSFSQVDCSVTRKYGGTGLGLAICRQLVDLMGGTIAVESDPAHGSTFSFVVPLTVADESRIRVSRASEDTEYQQMETDVAKTAVAECVDGRTRCRILVAEDNEVNQLVAGEILEHAGYGFDIVPDGRQAVEAVAGGEYHLVLMDREMPVMDGLTATREIRKLEYEGHTTTERGNRIPIIALTAHAIQGDRQQCIAAGMDGYVSKPIDAGRLLAAIDGLLRQQEHATAGDDLSRQERENGPSEGDAAGQAVPLDIADLKARCMGSMHAMQTVLRAFSKHVRSGVQSVHDALGGDDTEATIQRSHSLKGAAANASAGALSSIAAQIETMSRKDKINDCRAQLPALDREMERCLDFIEKALDQLSRGEDGNDDGSYSLAGLCQNDCQ